MVALLWISPFDFPKLRAFSHFSLYHSYVKSTPKALSESVMSQKGCDNQKWTPVSLCVISCSISDFQVLLSIHTAALQRMSHTICNQNHCTKFCFLHKHLHCKRKSKHKTATTYCTRFRVHQGFKLSFQPRHLTKCMYKPPCTEWCTCNRESLHTVKTAQIRT